VAGPDEVTFDALVDAVNGGPVAKRHLHDTTGTGGDAAGGADRTRGDAAAGADGSLGGLTPAQLEVLAAGSLPDPGLPVPPGLVPTRLAGAVARSAGPVRPGVAGPA
jgi:hypothetical protein